MNVNGATQNGAAIPKMDLSKHLQDTLPSVMKPRGRKVHLLQNSINGIGETDIKKKICA